jgi:toxin FitB
LTYLVDANVLSEATKPIPDAKAIAWLRYNERAIVVDPIILGEIQFGIFLLPTGRRKQRLQRWFEQGVKSLYCLRWEAASGLCWARLLADLRKSGQTMSIKDSLIAATALVYDLTVATRNTTDFKKARVRVLDPFA